MDHQRHVYKADFKERLDKLGLLDQVDPAVWVKKWNGDIQPVGSGQAVLKYVAPYVYRVAISDHRLISFDENEVTYKIKPAGENRYRERAVDACRFVGGFLQHVLPGGFQKKGIGMINTNSTNRNPCRSDHAQRTRIHRPSHLEQALATECRNENTRLVRHQTGRRNDLSSYASLQKPLLTRVRESKSLSF